MRQHRRVGITQHRKQTKIGGKIYGRVENAGHTLPVRDDHQKVASMQCDHTENTVHDKLLLILGHLLANNNGCTVSDNFYARSTRIAFARRSMISFLAWRPGSLLLGINVYESNKLEENPNRTMRDVSLWSDLIEHVYVQRESSPQRHGC